MKAMGRARAPPADAAFAPQAADRPRRRRIGLAAITKPMQGAGRFWPFRRRNCFQDTGSHATGAYACGGVGSARLFGGDRIVRAGICLVTKALRFLAAALLMALATSAAA